MKGKTYKDRITHQLDEWVKGNPIHNTVDDECCPDFSCCVPENLADEETRKTFKAICISGNEDAKAGMLMDFLGKCIAKKYPQKKVHITDGNVSHKKDLN